MSIAAVAWAMKARVGSPTLKAVLVAVCNFADEDGCCWPSQQKLAFNTELSERAVRTALAALEAAGFLSREERPRRSDKTRQSDMIRIDFSRAYRDDIMRNDVPVDLPAPHAETMRHVVPDHAEGRAAYKSGEPSKEPSEGACARRKKALLPADWRPTPEVFAAVLSLGFTADQAERELRRFRLHNRGEETRRLDWGSAFEGWCIRAAEMQGKSAKPPQATIAPATGAVVGGKVYAAQGSRQLKAWQEWSRRVRGRDGPTDGKGGWWFETEWPPDHLGLEQAQRGSGPGRTMPSAFPPS